MNDILDKCNGETNVHSLHDLNVPRDYYSISIPKIEIATAIRNEVKAQHLTIRKLAGEVGMKHPQILRVTGGENYNIETLLKILDALDLQIVIQRK